MSIWKCECSAWNTSDVPYCPKCGQWGRIAKYGAVRKDNNNLWSFFYGALLVAFLFGLAILYLR